METALTAETQLLNDVEALRARHPNTQELYREVCAVMFFRYGLTPTANRLYQLVRKGSMSAPAEALAKFWSQLRERSRVTIEGPDLPESLRTGAGELLSALWKQAQDAAAASLAVLREEAEARVAAAARAEEEAAARAAALAAELEAGRAALAAARDEVTALRHQLGASEALNTRLRERADEARKELNEQHAWFKTVERDHAAALDKLRTQLQSERDAAEARQRQAMQDIERLQRALDAGREAAEAATERHRAELRESLSQAAALHQRIGALEGSAAAAAAARDGAFSELAGARRELAAARAEAAAATGRAAALETALRHAAERAEPARPRKRAPAD
ncbi:DNA-binding protein [Massilia sp. METH4]|uniref:DNA-binding protein n=1 Tax=Massilia sp. METH4 TaxID=3123041 RepID=UPI0030D1C457